MRTSWIAVWLGWCAAGCVDADALCEQLEDRALDCEVPFDRAACVPELESCSHNEELMIGAYLACVGDDSAVRDFECSRPQSGEDQQVALERLLACARDLNDLSPECRLVFSGVAALTPPETTPE